MVTPFLPFFFHFPLFFPFLHEAELQKCLIPETVDREAELGSVILGKSPCGQHRLAPTLPKTWLKMSVPGLPAALPGCGVLGRDLPASVQVTGQMMKPPDRQ